MTDKQLFIGPFRLDQAVAEGGMGQVWRGYHEASDTVVAVKVLTGRMTQRPRFRQTFRNEARAMSGLDHPNIVRIFDFGELAKTPQNPSKFAARSPYIAMEFVDGGVAGPDRIMNWTELKRCLLALLDALSHAHARGVIHRDLKPNNLLLNAQGELRLSDFGIAFATDDSGVDVEQLRAAGTPEYMAPEQCHGMWRDFGPWTDLYGVGCVAYTLVAGVPPFQEEHPMGTMLAKLERDPPPLKPRFAVPTGFERWLRQLLRKTPRHRFQRAADAAWALTGLALGPHEIRVRDTKEDLSLTSISDEMLVAANQDTIVTFQFDTDNSEEVDAIQQLEPNYEGLSTSNLRSIRAPIPVDWSAGRRHTPLPLENAGLELFGLRRAGLVGRSDICDALWKILRDTHTQASPRAVILKGPSGVGKSRIGEWLCERAHEVGAATVLRAHHASESGPADGVVSMLARHLRCVGLDRQATQERLAALLQSQGGTTDDALQLTELFRPAHSDELSESSKTVRFFSLVERHLVLSRHLERMALDRTVVLWLEDVHFGHESLDFVQWLLDRERCAFMVVMTVSEEALAERTIEPMVLEELMELDTVKVFDIGHLGVDGHRAFVRSLLALEPGLSHAVETRTAGNPQFAVHLLQNWVNEGWLIPGERGFALASGAPKALPRDLAEVWGARLNTLLSGRPAKDIISLELAAVLGQEVDRNEWAALCRLAGIHPSVHLVDEMFRDRLLRPIDPENAEVGFVFLHALLREALERNAADEGRLIEHHRNCIALLRTLRKQGDRLARHLRESGDLHASLGPIRRSVEDCLNTGNHRAAAAALIDWRETLRSMGIPETGPGWMETEVAESIVCLLRGRFEDAERMALNLAEAARKENLDAIVCECFTLLAQISVDQGNYDQGIAHIAEALRAYEDLNQPDLYGRCQWQKGRALRALGQFNEARTALIEAENAFLAIDDLVRAAQCLLGQARVHLREGDPETAKRLNSAARDDLEAMGARAGIAAAEHSQAEVLRLEGDLLQAEARYRQARLLYSNVGSSNAVRVELDLSTVLLSGGRFLEARLLLDRVLETAIQQGRKVLEAKATMNMVICAAKEQDWHNWDRYMSTVNLYLNQSKAVDPDIALQSQNAGAIAIDAGQPDRALEAFRLSQNQWMRMDRGEEALAVAERIDALKKTLSSWP